jgi:hypothetical protein
MQLCAEELGKATADLVVASTGGVLEGGEDAVVGWVSGEVIEPEVGSSSAGEDVRDPREGVVEVPKGDTDAGVDLGASTSDLQKP